MFKTVFVTVGTTKFDELLEAFDSVHLQRLLSNKFGTTKIVIQCGKTTHRPTSMLKMLKSIVFR